MKSKINIKLENKITELEKIINDNLSSINLNILKDIQIEEKINRLEEIIMSVTSDYSNLSIKCNDFFDDTKILIHEVEQLRKNEKRLAYLETELKFPSVNTLNNMKLETIEKFIRSKKIIKIDETNN